MTLSETRALRHAALLVLGLGVLRIAAENVQSPVTTHGAAVQDLSGLAVLLDRSRGSRDEARRRSLPLTGGERIDPNTAGEEDLDRLPGVGPAVARRIVQMRQDRGPFGEPRDLLSVPGVGPATLARITPYLEWSTQPRVGDAALRDEKIHQIYSLMQAGKKHGIQTMNDAFQALYMQGIITKEEAVKRSADPKEFLRAVGETPTASA